MVSGRDPEYDRFGPWVLEISEDDPPPPLFLPHLTRTASPLLSVKIPRRLARREAHPGMHLYDYLVSLYPEDMVVLQRVREDVVEERTIRYRDVSYLRLREELLRGNLQLAIPGGLFDLPYNTVSGELMARLSGLVRERFLPTDEVRSVELPSPAAPGSGSVEPPELSFYFEHLLRDQLQGETGRRLLAAQPSAHVAEREDDLFRRLLFGLTGKRLLESVHLTDGRELKVIDRGRALAYRWQPVYGSAETIVPLANIDSVRLDGEVGSARPVTLAVETTGGRLEWAFIGDNPMLEAYQRALATMVGPA